MSEASESRTSTSDFDELLAEYSKIRQAAEESARVAVTRDMRQGRYGPVFATYAANARPRHAAS